MYSDSIKEKQQELLDVLFKKANGSPFSFTIGGKRTVEPSLGNRRSSAIGAEDAKNYNEDLIAYKKIKGSAPMLGVGAAADEYWDGFEAFRKEQDNRRYEEGRRKLEEQNKDLERNFRLSIGDSYKDSLQNLGDQAKKIEPEKTTSEEVSAPEQNNSASVLPISEQHLETPVPLEDIPKPAPIDPTPTEQPPKKDDKKGNPEIDPIALAKVLLEKAMRHKATSLGGLGGAGLGLLLGKSVPSRLLWGLLGGLGGAGLGYAAEKYIK